MYGRTLIFSEKDTIKRALSFFDSDEENHKLADFIVSKNIEIGKEIMSEDYLELLEIERDYINARFISKKVSHICVTNLLYCMIFRIIER